MHTPSCLFLLRRLHLRPNHNPKAPASRSRGQALVIFAVALVALLLFIGLAVDAAALYVSYGQLKRAVDASVVSAANDFKKGATKTRMEADVAETLRLHNVPMDTVDLHLYLCDENQDGVRDPGLQTTVPQFYARCPNTPTQQPRKLVWVDARQNSPVYFLTLLGLSAVPLRTNAIAEAAAIDIVIVLDISESMGVDTTNPVAYSSSQYVDKINPNDATTGCNPGNTCRPLRDAKDAAKALIDTLYEGYDQVALVTFDQAAVIHPMDNKSGVSVRLTNDFDNAKTKIDSIGLHDDPPYAYLWSSWAQSGRFNPSNPDDRDGNGKDWDNDPLLYGADCPHTDTAKMLDRWWDHNTEGAPDPFGWGGVPCDNDNGQTATTWLLDAYDWDSNGQFDASDQNQSNIWMNNNDPWGASTLPNVTMSPLSTCTGCGIRQAGNILKAEGRPGAVWVIVFLSDGNVNYSDRYENSSTQIPIAYPNGFCIGRLSGTNLWTNNCVDKAPATRYCIDTDSDTCPPSTAYDATSPSTNYTALDYAMDMTDEVALTSSTNPNELAGNDIAIYTIGLGSSLGSGENLLRYMAAVGDDGNRETNPCASVGAGLTCGSYYHATTGADLLPIFEDIATRIYTRITD